MSRETDNIDINRVFNAAMGVSSPPKMYMELRSPVCDGSGQEQGLIFRIIPSAVQINYLDRQVISIEAACFNTADVLRPNSF